MFSEETSSFFVDGCDGAALLLLLLLLLSSFIFNSNLWCYLLQLVKPGYNDTYAKLVEQCDIFCEKQQQCVENQSTPMNCFLNPSNYYGKGPLRV